MVTYHQFHLNLLKLGYNNLLKQPPFNDDETYEPEAEELLEFYTSCIALYEEHASEAFDQGQTLMIRIVRGYPQLTHLIARDLFWLFGGECIHYLTDEEIERFQNLDEMRFELERQGTEYNYLDLRTSIEDEPSGKTH